MKNPEEKTITELFKDYVYKDSIVEQERDRITQRIELKNGQIARLRKKQQNLPYLSWIDSILRPIAAQLEKHYPDYHAEILGPFGMCGHTSIHLYRNGVDREHQFDAGNCLGITFRPHMDAETIGEALGILDESVDMGQFTKGSMGEVNGVNHPVIPFPPDVDITWLLKWVK